ncbi:unnamed protein product [Acanthoscelides obtectus]|uniref:Uncharacterized protein n=1 Tax=Acanthoscelides obtectus TaxID=200917 RepID=A0A9P0NWP1_ACAOB|nr:unnamed protein product [Acanthoscelides obtectus]CAK1654417.1 hypothetical protein AOBTE_LOCUS18573 [Acanthoscelides obtectus]
MFCVLGWHFSEYLDLQWPIGQQPHFALSSEGPQVAFEEKPFLSVRISYECTDSQSKRSTDTENSTTPGPSSVWPNLSGTPKPKRARIAYTNTPACMTGEAILHG